MPAGGGGRLIFCENCIAFLLNKCPTETLIYRTDLRLQFRINSVTTGNHAKAVSQGTRHTSVRVHHTKSQATVLVAQSQSQMPEPKLVLPNTTTSEGNYLHWTWHQGCSRSACHSADLKVSHADTQVLRQRQHDCTRQSLRFFQAGFLCVVLAVL